MSSRRAVPAPVGRGMGRGSGAAVVLSCGLVMLAGACRPAPAARVRIATTTSVENSGLLDHLRRAVLEEKGIELEALAVGSGKAIALARDGAVDIAITHHPAGEASLAEEPGVIAQRRLFENRFIVVGPEENSAGVENGSTILEAMRRIHAAGAPFVGRGDESGTHAREMELWKLGGIDPRTSPGYRALGQGMSALLRSASELGAYTLTDDATFAQLAGSIRLVPIAEGGEGSRNVYTVTWVRRGDETKNEAAGALYEWLGSEAGIEAVRSFRISGRNAFRPLDPLSGGG